VQSCGLFGYSEIMGFLIKKNDYTLICRLFQGSLLDPFLERPAEEERQTFSKVSMLLDGDCGYGNIRQAWMVIVEKA
jgi:hypothetical protein